MDRALIADESLAVFKFICCFLVFNCEFYFLQGCCKNVAPLYVIVETLLQICQRLLTNPLAILLQMVRRVSATLWPIF
jgi:hypothetical protein